MTFPNTRGRDSNVQWSGAIEWRTASAPPAVSRDHSAAQGQVVTRPSHDRATSIEHFDDARRCPGGEPEGPDDGLGLGPIRDGRPRFRVDHERAIDRSGWTPNDKGVCGTRGEPTGTDARTRADGRDEGGDEERLGTVTYEVPPATALRMGISTPVPMDSKSHDTDGITRRSRERQARDAIA
jgi:hypothetical protein